VWWSIDASISSSPTAALPSRILEFSPVNVGEGY